MVGQGGQIACQASALKVRVVRNHGMDLFCFELLTAHAQPLHLWAGAAKVSLGVCLENNSTDTDCCATPGTASCKEGYTMKGGHCAECYPGGAVVTCCMPDSMADASWSDTCDWLIPDQNEEEIRVFSDTSCTDQIGVSAVYRGILQTKGNSCPDMYKDVCYDLTTLPGPSLFSCLKKLESGGLSNNYGKNAKSLIYKDKSLHCESSWCTSPGPGGSLDCWAGTESEQCTCSQGTAVATGESIYYSPTYYNYVCCEGAKKRPCGIFVSDPREFSSGGWSKLKVFLVVLSATCGVLIMASALIYVWWRKRLQKAQEAPAFSSATRAEIEFQSITPLEENGEGEQQDQEGTML